MALCPICQGTKRQKLRDDEKAFSWNRGKEDQDCRNCGGQYMFGTPTGYTKKDPITGLGCPHSYTAKTVGNCLTEYTCTFCGTKHQIDSGG